ncbi:MAG: response regulator [Roseburia sp.]|nr:response regulator [Roseburia sp.]MCM1099623.1 response regulator [Ruminococcus flavefaciens]
MYRILVADDEADERALIRFLLQDFEQKAELLEARNGKEALKLIERKEIDILISDIQMGLMSGLELASKVRETHPDMEILFFSGYDDFEYVRSALSLGAVNYILKPVNPEELKRTLASIIARLDSKSLQFVKSRQYIEKKFYGSPRDGEASGPEDGMDPYADGVLRLEAKKQSYSEDDANLLREVEAAIFMKNSQALRDKVNELLEKYTDSNPCSHIYVRYICTHLLRQFMQQLPCQMKEFEQAAEKVFMFRHFEDIEKLIRDYLEQVADSIDREARSSNYVVCQVKQYIDFHYQEELTLNQLADQFFLSANYLSNVFTKHTGQSLNKYINQVRIAKAKELLRNTNRKIGDVGKEVGFGNPSYFIRKFQEMCGTTPERYRMKPVEGKEEKAE